MSAPHETQAAHPTALLLPWYVSGTLKDQERLAVEHHLADCDACRREMEELKALRLPMRDAFAATPAPAPRLKTAVMAKIQSAREDRPASNSQPAALPVGETLEQWFRNLFAPRWMPTLAATLLVGQLLLLLWSAGQQSPLPPSTISTRAVAPVSTKVQILFQESVTEAQIRRIVQGLQGRIVDGPGADGRYTVEVGPAVADQVDARIQSLRQQSKIIRRAERLSP
ncbi:MAG: zf-HC2 domain-containing protein [Nitrospiraceae bacterium]|nr:zf-HC2 domain-containing protein [Nitrospiraceae bacterium]